MGETPGLESIPIRVGVGLVGRGGSYLIRQRPPTPGSPMPGIWEFPGGKCEPGEGPDQATVRECREEMGLDVSLVSLRRVVIRRYDHGLVELHYYDCILEGPDAEPEPGSGFRWVAAGDLPGYPFPDANGPVVLELARQAASGPGRSA